MLYIESVSAVCYPLWLPSPRCTWQVTIYLMTTCNTSWYNGRRSTCDTASAQYKEENKENKSSIILLK